MQKQSPSTPLTPEERIRRANEVIEARKRADRRKRIGRALSLGCVFYVLFSLLYFLLYVAIIFPGTEATFSKMMAGGMSVPGHGCILLMGLLVSGVITLLGRKKPIKEDTALLRYAKQVGIWFTSLILLLVISYALYLDMAYNPYNVTQTALLKGPSFRLTLSCLGLSLCMPPVGRIYRSERLPVPIRVMVHLLITVVCTTLFLYFLGGGFASASDYLVFAVVASVLYCIFSVLYFMLRAAGHKDENEAQAYENIYMTPEIRRQREAEKSSSKK